MLAHSERFEKVINESAQLRAQSHAVHDSFRQVRAALQESVNSVSAAFEAALGTYRFPTAHHQLERRHDLATGADPRRDSLAVVLKATLPWTSNEHSETLARSLPVRTVTRRAQIAGDADIRSRLYMLASGVAKLGFVSHGSNRRLLAILSAGDFLGVMALVRDAENPADPSIGSYYCDSISECTIAEIDPAQLSASLPKDRNYLLTEILSQTVGGWLRMLMWRCAVAELDVRNRLLANLVSLAQKFGVRGPRGIAINFRLTEFDLAALIGASRPKVSTCLVKLGSEGLIKRDRRQFIVSDTAMAASPIGMPFSPPG